MSRGCFPQPHSQRVRSTKGQERTCVICNGHTGLHSALKSKGKPKEEKRACSQEKPQKQEQHYLTVVLPSLWDLGKHWKRTVTSICYLWKKNFHNQFTTKISCKGFRQLRRFWKISTHQKEKPVVLQHPHTLISSVTRTYVSTTSHNRSTTDRDHDTVFSRTTASCFNAAFYNKCHVFDSENE